LHQHLEDRYATLTAESEHPLGFETVRKPEITFWTVGQQQSLLGCGALKNLSPHHGEIKSMHTVRQHIILQAKAREL